MLNRWQSTIVDRRGDVVPGAVLMIRRESDQAIVTVYKDREGTIAYPMGQVTADDNGYAYFYGEVGLYRITSAAPAINWRDVGIGAPVDVMQSLYDATPGRVMTTGAFGVGITEGGILPVVDVDLDDVLVSGDYYCSDACESLPGSLPGFLSVSAGSDPNRKLQRFVEDADDGKEFRRILDGTPGVEWRESGGNVDEAIEWLGKAIGERFTLDFDAPLPPTDDPRFRFIVLTAGQSGVGGYNEGVLTGETVSGTAPNIVAEATIDLAGSPLDGQTKRLINTTREFLRPGTSSDSPQSGQNESHLHFLSSAAGLSPGSSWTYSAGVNNRQLVNSTALDGGDEARPRNFPAPYFMRIN